MAAQCLLLYIILVKTIYKFDFFKGPTENCHSELGFLNKYITVIIIIIIIIIIIVKLLLSLLLLLLLLTITKTQMLF